MVMVVVPLLVPVVVDVSDVVCVVVVVPVVVTVEVLVDVAVEVPVVVVTTCEIPVTIWSLIVPVTLPASISACTSGTSCCLTLSSMIMLLQRAVFSCTLYPSPSMIATTLAKNMARLTAVQSAKKVMPTNASTSGVVVGVLVPVLVCVVDVVDVGVVVRLLV